MYVNLFSGRAASSGQGAKSFLDFLEETHFADEGAPAARVGVTLLRESSLLTGLKEPAGTGSFSGMILVTRDRTDHHPAEIPQIFTDFSK